MLAAFWSGLGGEFAKQWMVRILTPAVVFWAGGVAAVWWHARGDGVRANGWTHELTATAAALQRLPGLAQVLLVVAALFVVVASAIAAEHLTLPVLRFLEGYWRRPRWLRERLVAYRRWRRRRWQDRVAKLALRQRIGALTGAELRKLDALEATPDLDDEQLRELRRLRALRDQRLDPRMTADLGRGRRYLRESPDADGLRMPTRLGDILRAAEQRPYGKYGLSAVVCWYALWLLLPAETKTEIVQARTALDRATRGWLWGALFLVWTPWTWWALPIGIVVPALVYSVGILGAARLFGELIGSAFDLYRFRLYDELHLPRPTSPAEERRRTGKRVNDMLWGGLDEPGLVYVDRPPEPKAAEAAE